MKRPVKRHEVKQPPGDKPYRFIPLTQGQNAIVDVGDVLWISQWNWSARWAKNTKSFYAVRWPNIRMHREILGCKPHEQADHKNNNTLDNRRENLRKCTRLQNCQNRRKRTDAKSFKGVWYCPEEKKWRAHITDHGRRYIIGRFNTAVEAAIAYDAEAERIFGEFAHTNF